MRTAFAIAAGLAVASAKTYTTTESADVTVTSCAPTHTNCPYKPEAGHWEDWTTSSVADPATTTSSKPAVKTTTTSYDPDHTWADWTSSTTSSRPAARTTTTTSYDPGHTWADWTSSTTSSRPAVVTTTTSYDPGHTWADWTSTTSSRPAVVTTTTSYDPGHTWADWTSSTTSSRFAVVTTSTRTPAAATGTPGSTYNPSPVSPTIAKYTGAANANTGSFVAVGLAGLAAFIIV